MKSTLEHDQVPNPKLYDFAIHKLVAPFVRLYGGVHYQGGEVLQKQQGGFILAPAHRSQLDILATGLLVHEAIGAQVHFMGKQELWKLMGVRRLFSELGAFPVDRSRSLPPETQQHIGKVLDNAGVICIYPEGTRKKGNIIQPGSLKESVAVLAAKYQVPLIPVGISGTEKGGRRPITLAVGEPVDVPALTPEPPLSDLQALRARRPIMAELYPKLQAAQDEAVAMRLAMRPDIAPVPH